METLASTASLMTLVTLGLVLSNWLELKNQQTVTFTWPKTNKQTKSLTPKCVKINNITIQWSNLIKITTHTSLDCGWKPESPERTHTDTGEHVEAGFEPRTFLLRGHRTNHCARFSYISTSNCAQVWMQWMVVCLYDSALRQTNCPGGTVPLVLGQLW